MACDSGWMLLGLSAGDESGVAGIATTSAGELSVQNMVMLETSAVVQNQTH